MKILTMGAVATATAVLLAGCNRKEEKKPVPPGVTVSPVINGYVVNSKEIIGQTVAYDSVDLTARVKGFLLKKNFEEGHMVTKGQLLYEIEKDEYIADVEGAQAQLTRTEAALMNANIEYERQKKLISEDATARRTYDDAVAGKMIAEANVRDAKAALAKAKLNLSYTDVKAPFDGRIGLATYSVGNMVGPDSSKLANVVNLNPMRVEFNINELDILKLNLKSAKDHKDAGTVLIVKLKFQNNTMYNTSGKIEFSSNVVNSRTGTLMVQAVFDNKEHILVPGMYVRVVLIDPDKIKALLIPQQSIMEDQTGKYVFKVGADNKIARANVKVGIKSGPNIQIIEGLKENDRVIIDGIQKVRPGIEVNPLVNDTYVKRQQQLDAAIDGTSEKAPKQDPSPDNNISQRK
jgi:membrane fusion protein (multidrug efflux system)